MRARRTDGAHKDVLKAIKDLGLQAKSMHAAGSGFEDIIVAIPYRMDDKVHHPFVGWWLLVEVKTIERESTGYYRHTSAQQNWYGMTLGFPRIVVTSAENAVDSIKRLL